MSDPLRAAGSRMRRADAARAAVVIAAFAVTLGGLHTILDGVAWWFLCVLLCITVFGSGVVVRALLPVRSVWARMIAPVAAVIASAVVVMFRFGAGTGFAFIVPNADTLEHFRKLLRDAGYSITWQTVPANVDEPISFVLALGIIALAVIGEIAVFSLRLPALVGLPLAAIFLVPGITPEGRTDGWFFAASALVYLALLVVGRRRHSLPALVVGAVAVIGGLVAPSILPSTDFTAPASGLGPSVSTGVNPLLRLGDDLREGDKRTALTYSTVSGDPEYLRLTVISDFTGTDWGPGQPNLDPANRPVSFPRPEGLSVGVSTTRDVTYVHVGNLVSPWLPVPYAASSVTGLAGSWQFLPDSFTVASNVDLARGENYTVSSLTLTPTPKQLLAAGTRLPAGLEPYLALPGDTPALIAQTARRVAAGESSGYEKALALQEFLRSAPFQYSETAPKLDGYDGTGVDFVAAFLEQHRGYCIHFASAMAVMSREIGIPSRIIVGFQPGHLQNGDDRGRRLFAVTTKDLHAWPELYFDGIGWVRFEPTPSRGSVPDYANPTTAGVPPLTGADSGGGVSSGRDNDGNGPKIDEGPTAAGFLTHGSNAGLLISGGILAALVILFFLPGLLREGRRRRRLSMVNSGRESIAWLWREILESAQDVGTVIKPTLTPREAVEQLRRMRGMTAQGAEALERLARALERDGYGRPGSAAAPAERAWWIADTKLVLHCLMSGAHSDARMRARLLPPSLVTSVAALAKRFA